VAGPNLAIRMYGRVLGVAVVGVQGHLIRVEAHVGRGLPTLALAGLPGAGIQDARERVRPAVESVGLEWPLRRVVVNFSPANVRKEGPGFDLPIAMGVLAASAQVPSAPLASYVFAGELSLKGELVATPGILAVAIAAGRAGVAGVVVPLANAAEAVLVEGIEVVAAPTLAEVVGFLRGTWKPEPGRPLPAGGVAAPQRAPSLDFSEVRGQGVARRALEIAAAGGHNTLLMGPPGAGKTMLARRLPTILPAMTRSEALEATRLHSVAGLLTRGGLLQERPFRAPHHSASASGLLGGGSAFLRPGEVSLAHNGVLFLDEITEFRRDALEGLRQPLEDGRVVVTRASGAVEFPARFTLVAASNPCPCGFDGDPRRALPVRATPRRALSTPSLRAAPRSTGHPARRSPAHAVGAHGLWGGGAFGRHPRTGGEGSNAPGRSVGGDAMDMQRTGARGHRTIARGANEWSGGPPLLRRGRHVSLGPRVRPGCQGRAHHRRPRRVRSRRGRSHGGGSQLPSAPTEERGGGGGVIGPGESGTQLRRPSDLAKELARSRAARGPDGDDMDAGVTRVDLVWPPGFVGGSEDRGALIVLLHLASLTPRRLLELAARHASAAVCLERVHAGEAGSTADRRRAATVDPTRVLERLAGIGARMVAVGDPEYPKDLLDLFDPPAALFAMGASLGEPPFRVGIVGARNCSPGGAEVSRLLGGALGRAGVCVVSGGARGIDAEAHRGALEAGGRTIAVLGCGIDIVYPRENRGLLEAVRESGCLVSEYPPGLRAEPFRFPARNRIVAALSRAVVVVEGAAGSGSMITADHATDLGRDVYAVPGAVSSALAHVPLALIRSGATMIRGPDDLLFELGIGAGSTTGDGSPEPSERGGPLGLSPHERTVWEALGASVTPDGLAAATGLQLPLVVAALLGLELRGLVQQVGGRYERRPAVECR